MFPCYLFARSELGDGISSVRSSRFKPGDVVRLTDGPRRDLAALFDGSLTGSGRVTVLLKLLGQQARVEVNEAWLLALA